MEAAIIEAEAMKLPAMELAVLVERLQEKLSSRRISFLDEHLSESIARFGAYKSGEVSSVDGKSFVSQLRNNLLCS